MIPGYISAVSPIKLTWRILSTEHFYIHYQKGNRQCAEMSGHTAERVFSRFAPKLDLEWKEKNSIFIYPDTSFLCDNSIYGQGDIYPDAGGDVDLFKHRVVIADVPSYREYTRTLKSLVLRSMIYRRLMGTGGSIMRLLKSTIYAEWLVIGACEYFADTQDAVRNGQFAALVSEKEFFPLTELFNFDYLSRARTAGAIAQSAHMVRWIVLTWGEDKLWEILREYPRYWSNDRLLTDVLGIDQETFLERFSNRYHDILCGPALPSVAVAAAAGNSRFPADSLYPVIHAASGRLYFTGEREGALNLFFLNDSGKVKRVFRETPFREIEGILSPVVISKDRGFIRVIRFRKPITAEFSFSSTGLVSGIEYRKGIPDELKWTEQGETRVFFSSPYSEGRSFCVCEDLNGVFLARLERGSLVRILERHAVYGISCSPERGRVYFGSPGKKRIRSRIYSVSENGDDLRLELDSSFGVLFPAVSGDTMFFCTIEPHQYVIYRIPLDSLLGEPADPYLPKEEQSVPDTMEYVVQETETVNPVTSDVVIPGLLWNASDEYGLNEFWISAGLSTGLVSTSGFEEESSGAFLAPQVQAEYLHKTRLFDFSAKALFQAGDVLKVKDYETRNKLTVDLLLEHPVNFRVSAGAGIEANILERRISSDDDYEDVRDIGAVLHMTFNGVLARDYLPRRGIGVEFSAARFLESWGSTETYSRFEIDTDLFLPVTADSVFQIFAGAYAAVGDTAPEFDLGRERGVFSQPLNLNSGRFMGVARVAYRFPLFRDLNWNLSGVILLRQIRMGIFADRGIVSNSSFDTWELNGDNITERRSVGLFFLFDVYPVEGFQMPVVLSIAHDPENDTEQIMLEFDFYF